MTVGRGGLIEAFEPAVDEGEGGREREAMVKRGKGLEMGAGSAQEGFGGVDSSFLDMDEGAGDLDQALVEGGVGTASSGEPDSFEGIMCFVEEPAVEEFEEGRVSDLVGLGWELLGRMGSMVPMRPAHGC